MQWQNEDEMFALMKEKLYTPVVGDILDGMGYYHQFLPQNIRPLRDDMKLAGKAMTVLMIDVYGPQKKPFGLLTEALDQLQKNEIYRDVYQSQQKGGTEESVTSFNGATNSGGEA